MSGQDLLFAARMLRRQPLPTVTALLCLALGIGATTSVFSVGNGLLLRPLPFPKNERLVQVFSANGTSQPNPPNSYLDMLDWRRRAHSFTSLGGIGQWNFIVQLGEPALVRGGLITTGFFATLGASPEAGRLFTTDEEQPGGPLVVVVSHSLAERLPGGARAALGQQLRVSGESRTIVGVIPDRWRFPSRAELWVPVAHLDGRDSRGTRNLEVIAALRPGATLDDARRDMQAVGRQLAGEYGATNAQIQPTVEPLRERYVGPVRSSLDALTVASLLVLLVACANAAGLQLARGAQRTREIAMRAALGAGRGRIRRQLLTESVLLSLVASALGILLAIPGSTLLGHAVAGSAPAWVTFELDARALAFTVTVSVLVGVGFGVVPASRLARLDPASVLRGGGLGMQRATLQRGIVVVEIALSLTLLVGAGLAALGVYRLEHVPLGFDPGGVLTFRVLREGPQYDDASRRAAMTAEFVRRLEAIPGVTSAAGVGVLPTMGYSRYGLTVEGHPNPPGQEPLVTGNVVTPGYFRAMRIGLVSGRDFRADEGADSALVAIVSEAFARHYLPGSEAVGHRLKVHSAWATIVGVVRDVRQTGLTDAPEPEVYFPHHQERWDAMNYVVRAATGDPEALASAIRRALFALEPTTPAYDVQTMRSIIDASVAPPRTVGFLIEAFAMIALLLATAGVFAAMAFFVSQRTRELGIRMAMGAAPADLLDMVLRQGATMAGAGAILGLAGSGMAARVLAAAFYGVSAFEPLPYVAPTLLLAVTVIAATYAPARRASCIDPLEAFRAE
jgi:predicted permease